MQPNTPFHSRSFLWQGILILLPVGVLTVVGLYSLRQDRLLAEQDAKERGAAIAVRIAQSAAHELAQQLADYRSANSSLHVNLSGDLGLGGWADGSDGEDSAWQRIRSWQQSQPGLDLYAMPVADCVLNVQGELSSPQLYPLSPSPPDWLLELSPEQCLLWQQEEQAEFVSNNPAAAQAAITNFLATKPPDGARANAEFDLLLLKTRELSPSEAVAQLTESSWPKVTGLTEAGLSIAQLVCYRVLRLLPDRAGVPDDLFHDIAAAIAYRPSMLSPRLISEAERVATPRQMESGAKVAVLKSWWDADERARDVLRNFEGQHPSDARSNALFWIESPGGRFLLALDPQKPAPNWAARPPSRRREPGVTLAPESPVQIHAENLAEPDRSGLSSSNYHLSIYPESLVEKALDNAVTGGDISVPPYAVVELEIGGRELILQSNHFLVSSNGRSSPVLGEAAGSLPAGSLSGMPLHIIYPFNVRIFLADSDLLYAQQHQRTLLFGAIILASTFAALAGLMTAHRAFYRQQELNEMKSNFVSSVSHELRAPIASMRLLAESLERGKIGNEVKQKEYFGLLVQESRRLSMLIENILDFSRIERGSKKYEFEPADLGALAEDTVRLMRPCSDERRVELDLRKNGAADGEPFACDSLALQQALINLIDNAVKHSPPGSHVAVGLDGDVAEVRLWVEDGGPGIPPEEHVKIFERFYRRGSELRRETQGIGIGLTIVKHIVEAHRGRVTVRSAPGQGSRFTMELPRQ
jgi:signal transduction histidine kinase